MLAAIIPAFHETDAIATVVKNTLPHVDRVVVVDDGSKDGTDAAAREAGAEVVVHPENRGKGAAMETGVAAVAADIYVMLDADGQHDPSDIPQLVKGLEGSTMCIGSRFLGDISQMPFQRRLSNRLVSGICTLTTGIHLTDVQSGFRAFRGEHAAELVRGFERYTVEVGMVLRAADLSLVVTETPIIAVYGDERSKVNPLVDGLRVIRLLVGHLLGRR
ncbi:MAG: glycosyltransferase family 2 protein [Candidatus Undinarchaeales archaeon]|jgi:glycosyltransferase involved in cell wall biosynthesis|nr:glycosyltransferase family 2 protein [Candidatus Undinarchaeales archaeon]MDP7493126.1 glycosyltransferase family 2 protein [Candidatus Undinarchaeales archaeon]